MVVLTPLFFLEPLLVPSPNRPEDYYGFLGGGRAMQLVYLTIARDPVRYRPLMPICVLAKLAFFVPVPVLWMLGRTGAPTLAFASVDFLIAIGFAAAWRNEEADRWDPPRGPGRLLRFDRGGPAGSDRGTADRTS